MSVSKRSRERPQADAAGEGAMIVGRILGWLLLFCALAAVAIEMIAWLRYGSYRIAALGEIWSNLHANSLVGFGAFVEQRISPYLWTSVIVPLLSLAAWLVFVVPGALLVVLFRRRPKRKHSFRRS